MYINTQTNQVVSEQEIKSAYPNTSFSVPFNPPTYYKWIFPAPQPTHNPVIQSVRGIAPELTGLGHYEERWEIVNLFDNPVDEAAAIAADAQAKYQASVPKVVSRAQFILALLQLDLLDEVEAAIAQADRATQINYKERLEFERNYPLMLTMAAVLGKTEAEIDGLFMLAATL